MTTAKATGAITGITVRPTQGRVSPKPAIRTFRTSLESSASSLVYAVDSTSPMIPGGGIVAAAVNGAQSVVGGGGGSVTDIQEALTQDNMELLKVQQRMHAEDRKYSTLSNVIKARHETAKNSISNIR